MNRRAIAFWVGLAAVLLVAGIASGSRQQSGPPLHPSSTDPTGTRALIIFLDELGATVVDGLPDESTDTALLLADQLDDVSRADLDDWVADGGTLVVTDPSSDFAPPNSGFDAGDVLPAGDCTIGGLGGLRVEATSFLLFPHRDEGGDAELSATSWCFGDGVQSYLHVRPKGSGRIVSVGGGLTLANQNLDESDNAVLAAELLLGDLSGAENRPAPTVAVLFDPIVAPGSRSLGDLIPSGAKWAAAQLLVAFALYVLWRLPRFGRPVVEPQPVELPASLLVRATGELHRRAGGYREASTTLRGDLDRRLRRRLRVSPELPPAELVGAVSAAGDVEPNVVGRALVGPAALDSDGLSALVVDIDLVNDAVLGRNGSVAAPSASSAGGSSAPSATQTVRAATIDEHDPTIGDHP